MFAWLRETISSLAPIGPRRWIEASRALARADGWVPPMSLVALFGMVLFSNGLFVKLPLIWIITWVTWFVVGVGALAIVAARSLRSCARYGMYGWMRPRWWFELSRLLWIVGLFCILSACLPAFAPANNIGRWLTIVLEWMFVLAIYCFPSFFLAATIGYGISFARRLPRRGRAFECTDYFYTFSGAIGVVTFVAYAWLPLRPWPNGAMLCIAGVAGIALLVGGLGSIAMRHERNERRRAEFETRLRESNSI